MLCALGGSFSGVRAATQADCASLLACSLCLLGLTYGLLHHTLDSVPHHSFGHAEAALGVGPMALALLLLQALGALGVCCTVRRALSGVRGVALLLHALLLARVEMALRADTDETITNAASGEATSNRSPAPTPTPTPTPTPYP